MSVELNLGLVSSSEHTLARKTRGEWSDIINAVDTTNYWAAGGGDEVAHVFGTVAFPFLMLNVWAGDEENVPKIEST